MEPSSVSHGRSIIVIDLDGTLIPGNSFKFFTLFAFKTLPIGKKLAIAINVILRKLKLISHREMKFRILKVSGQVDVPAFVESLIPMVRNELLIHSPETALVLATAAPALYSVPLARKLGMDECLATKETDRLRDYVENRGEVKKEQVAALKSPILAIYTDHPDDLPLLILPAREKYWVDKNGGLTPKS